MKKAIVFDLCLLLVSSVCLPSSLAQNSPQWGLSEGVKARLGKGTINELHFSPDGTRLAVASSIGIWLYDTATLQEVALLAGLTYVDRVAFSPDGRTIASASADKSIRLWDTESGEHRRTLSGHTNAVSSVAFSPDGHTIASASGSGGWNGTIRLWDANTGKHRRTLTGHNSSVSIVAFSPDGRILASGR